MSDPIRVPEMGESVTSATVATLLKESGSYVKVDEEILELETDKVNQVLYAPADGILTLTVAVGDEVEIGQEIGEIQPGEAPDEAPKAAPEEKEKTPPPPKVKEEPTPEAKQEAKREVKHGEAIRVGVEELKKSTPPLKTPPPAERPRKEPIQERKKMTKLRKVIAKRLVEVKNETAMLTTFNEADMSNVIQARKEHQEAFQKRYGVKLGFMSFFVKAVVHALHLVPEIKSILEGDEILISKSDDISIAVSTDRGLVVPVVRNCEELNLAEIELEIAHLAEQARTGRLTVEDLQGGTFTITNGGVFGSLLSTPILNPPQSAILGMHKIQKRAVVVDDAVVIRPMMYLALSYDHRLVDGKEAVTFLVHLKNALEDPYHLLLEI